jgi:hypothetical protein
VRSQGAASDRLAAARPSKPVEPVGACETRGMGDVAGSRPHPGADVDQWHRANGAALRVMSHFVLGQRPQLRPHYHRASAKGGRVAVRFGRVSMGRAPDPAWTKDEPDQRETEHGALLFFLETEPYGTAGEATAALGPERQFGGPVSAKKTPVDMFRSRCVLAIRQAAARYRCSDGKPSRQKLAGARYWFAQVAREVRTRVASKVLFCGNAVCVEQCKSELLGMFRQPRGQRELYRPAR